MRELLNAYEGYSDEQLGRWEQARMIAFYSAFPHLKKGFKLTDIPIPGENMNQEKKSSQQGKEAKYKLLEKWNK